MTTRSTRLWFEPRGAKRSDGTSPLTDVYACQANIQILEADDEAQAARLVDALNAAALNELGA